MLWDLFGVFILYGVSILKCSLKIGGDDSLLHPEIHLVCLLPHVQSKDRWRWVPPAFWVVCLLSLYLHLHFIYMKMKKKRKSLLSSLYSLCFVCLQYCLQYCLLYVFCDCNYLLHVLRACYCLQCVWCVFSVLGVFVVFVDCTLMHVLALHLYIH